MASGFSGNKEMSEGEVSVRNLIALFTPETGAEARAKKLDFSGFLEEDQMQGEKMMRCRVDAPEREKLTVREKELHKKIYELECSLIKMLERLDSVEKSQDAIKAQNVILKNECDELKKKLSTNEKIAEGNKDRVDKLTERQEVWKVQQEKEQVNLKEIMENQIKQKEEVVEKTVLKIIKEKPNVVRDSVEKKKCVVVFGLKEEALPIRSVREQHERKVAEEVVQTIDEEQEGGSKISEEIEEVFRLGKYEVNKSRPLKIRLRSQVAAEELVAKSWKLATKEGYKAVWIRRDLNEEERGKIKELWNEAKEKNMNRSETEKKSFYWRVMDMKLRKWYTAKPDQRN